MPDPYRDSGRPNRIWQGDDACINLSFITGTVWKTPEEELPKEHADLELHVYITFDDVPFILSNEEGHSLIEAWLAWANG